MEIKTVNFNKIAEDFEREGFVLIPGLLSRDDIALARKAYGRMLKKVENGTYPFFRLYDDLLRFNVAGIEHIFHPDIYERDLFAAAVKTDVLNISGQLLKTEAPNMILNRIHTTVHYSHSGIWHRDADPGDDSSLQIAIYLYDEDRLWLLPRSHKREWTEEELALIGKSRKAALPGEIAVGGRAGDLFIFKSAILHRGSSVGRRAHIHFRFTNDPSRNKVRSNLKEWFNREPVLGVCDSHWRRMFQETMTDGDNNSESVRGHRDNSLKRRLIGTAAYYALFMLPEDSDVFEKRLYLVPSLKMRKLLGLEKSRAAAAGPGGADI